MVFGQSWPCGGRALGGAALGGGGGGEAEPYDRPVSLPTSRSSVQRPTIAISMGDPLGIGPEVIVKALSDPALRERADYDIYGSSEVLTRAAAQAKVTPFWAAASPGALDGGRPAGGVLLVDRTPPPSGAEIALPLDAKPGPSAQGGEMSFQYVEAAIRAAKRPVDHPLHADAIVTAPISKASWDLAGHGPSSPKGFPGHTELLASRFGEPRVGMLFVGPALRVLLATIHVPLALVPGLLRTHGLLATIELGHRACVQLGLPRPRIAVCGLNPHAGEGGLLGAEDDRIIAPAIRQAQSKGIDATGPWPGDTIFASAAAPPLGRGQYDLVIAMYHDQGLIPVKLVDGFKTVNVTVGLPVIRTSPAHGTAFDIAGKNAADPASMRAAIELAIRMVESRAFGDHAGPA